MFFLSAYTGHVAMFSPSGLMPRAILTRNDSYQLITFNQSISHIKISCAL